MLDIAFIRENPDRVRRGAERKRIPFDVDRVLALDVERRRLLAARETAKAEQNRLGKQVATLSINTLPVGSDSITAVYGGDANNGGSTSNAVVEVITAVTTSTARAQSSASASGLNACATNAPPADCMTQPASSHDTPSVSEASETVRGSASADSHSLTRKTSLEPLAACIRCSRPSRPRTPTWRPSADIRISGCGTASLSNGCVMGFNVTTGTISGSTAVTGSTAAMIGVTTAKLGRFVREISRLAGAEAPQTQPSPDLMCRFHETVERYGYWLATPQENAEVGLKTE